MHRSYEEILKRNCDFRVSYRFLTLEEGGRSHLPHQGIRSDFWYEHPENKVNNLFMIWPEFEDENGDLILEGVVPRKGFARMWIINDAYREYHREKIKIGTIGYFREGIMTSARCEVIELGSLLSDNSIE